MTEKKILVKFCLQVMISTLTLIFISVVIIKLEWNLFNMQVSDYIATFIMSNCASFLLNFGVVLIRRKKVEIK